MNFSKLLRLSSLTRSSQAKVGTLSFSSLPNGHLGIYSKYHLLSSRHSSTNIPKTGETSTTGTTTTTTPVTAAAASTETKTETPELPKIPLKEKARIYFTSMYNDYKDVYFETIEASKKKPKKATFYIMLAGGILICAWQSPDENSYIEELTNSREELELVAKSIRNPSAEAFINDVEKLHMKDLLGMSWHDTAWIPILNPTNVLDYFAERTNPFYDRTCNNEIVRMQRLSPEQLTNMTGLEYTLLHVQEPILYVVRKQHRHSSTQATPIADYYIIAGVVYQAPDIGSVINSRLMNTVNHLQSAFDEVLSYSRYNPSKGYSWEFKDKEFNQVEKKKEKKEDNSSLFQRQRVDMLLMELAKKFPLRPVALQGQVENTISSKPATPAGSQEADGTAVVKTEPQQVGTPKPDEQYNNVPANVPTTNGNTQPQQRMKPPPEKRQRLN